MRLDPPGNRGHCRVVGGEPARSVEDIDLELDLVQLGQRVLEWIGEVLVAGRPRGDQDQLLIAAVGGVGGLTGGRQQ